jgi:hypothetical protein
MQTGKQRKHGGVGNGEYSQNRKENGGYFLSLDNILYL